MVGIKTAKLTLRIDSAPQNMPCTVTQREQWSISNKVEG